MISDEYTREYDERQRQQRRFDSLERVASVAKRFGCELSCTQKEDDVSISVYMPNGKLFHRFNKLATTVAWADRWLEGQKTDK